MFKLNQFSLHPVFEPLYTIIHIDFYSLQKKIKKKIFSDNRIRSLNLDGPGDLCNAELLCGMVNTSHEVALVCILAVAVFTCTRSRVHNLYTQVTLSLSKCCMVYASQSTTSSYLMPSMYMHICMLIRWVFLSLMPLCMLLRTRCSDHGNMAIFLTVHHNFLGLPRLIIRMQIDLFSYI